MGCFGGVAPLSALSARGLTFGVLRVKADVSGGGGGGGSPGDRLPDLGRVAREASSAKEGSDDRVFRDMAKGVGVGVDVDVSSDGLWTSRSRCHSDRDRAETSRRRPTATSVASASRDGIRAKSREIASSSGPSFLLSRSAHACSSISWRASSSRRPGHARRAPVASATSDAVSSLAGAANAAKDGADPFPHELPRLILVLPCRNDIYIKSTVLLVLLFACFRGAGKICKSKDQARFSPFGKCVFFFRQHC